MSSLDSEKVLSLMVIGLFFLLMKSCHDQHEDYQRWCAERDKVRGVVEGLFQNAERFNDENWQKVVPDVRKRIYDLNRLTEGWECDSGITQRDDRGK